MHRRLWLAGVFVALVLAVPVANVHAATLSSTSLSVSSPIPSTIGVSYTFTGTLPASPQPIKCVKEVYTDIATGLEPANMHTNAGVTLDAATTYIPTSGWATTSPIDGTITSTSATGITPTTGSKKYVIDNITNSTITTAIRVQFNTYTNTDCVSSPVDSAETLFILTNGSTLSLTVDDTLTFTVNAVGAGQACSGGNTAAASTATTIPFGTVTAAANAIVCQDLQAATNATNGYTIYARYTAKPTNALAQTIQDLNNGASTNAAPTAFTGAGVEGYGYTTDDQTLGTGTPNRFYNGATYSWADMTAVNAELAYENAPTTVKTYRIGHQVGVSLVTKPGTYTTTVIYTCTPIY